MFTVTYSPGEGVCFRAYLFVEETTLLIALFPAALCVCGGLSHSTPY